MHSDAPATKRDLNEVAEAIMKHVDNRLDKVERLLRMMAISMGIPESEVDEALTSGQALKPGERMRAIRRIIALDGGRDKCNREDVALKASTNGGVLSRIIRADDVRWLAGHDVTLTEPQAYNLSTAVEYRGKDSTSKVKTAEESEVNAAIAKGASAAMANEWTAAQCRDFAKLLKHGHLNMVDKAIELGPPKIKKDGSTGEFGERTRPEKQEPAEVEAIARTIGSTSPVAVRREERDERFGT